MGTLSVEQKSIIESEQEVFLATDGKYRQLLRSSRVQDMEIHEYQSPNGVGYLLYEYETRKDGEYVKCTVKGSEAHRAFDWQAVPPATDL